MDFRDRDGGPLITWHDPESAFEAWQACSRGRPCDYTGITYDRLRGGSGIQWPCTAAHPDGTERLYTDGTFNTDPDYCETFGHDLATGAAFTADEYRAKQPGGRAFLHAVDYEKVDVPRLRSGGFWSAEHATGEPCRNVVTASCPGVNVLVTSRGFGCVDRPSDRETDTGTS